MMLVSYREVLRRDYLPKNIIQMIGEDHHLGDRLNVANEIGISVLREARKCIEWSDA